MVSKDQMLKSGSYSQVTVKETNKTNKINMNKTPSQIKIEVANSPYHTNWIKKAILELDNRDVVDALRDVEELRAFLRAKLGEVKAKFN